MKYNFGLIGHGISYSLSPKIHQTVGKVISKDINYRIKDLEKDDLNQFIYELKDNLYQGFNVTKPYKEEIYNRVDQLTTVAKNVGAVNTIYVKDGKVIGDNTDVFGFEYLLGYWRIDVKDKNILILGTGGAAKAVAYVLKNKGANYQYASRNSKKEMDEKVISYDEINLDVFDIYINATPIGTYPNVDDCPLDKSKVTNQIVIDLIYNPKQTKLMSYAKKAYNGYIMLLAQAIKSDMLWMNIELNIHDVLDKTKEVISYE